MFAFVLVALVAIAIVVNAQFDKLWLIAPGTTATTIAGVGVGSINSAVAAAALNGVGAFVERYSMSTYWVANETLKVGLPLDAATSNGVTVVSSTSLILVSNDSKTYNKVPGITGISQSANVYGDKRDKFALVGTFLVSSDSKVPETVAGVVYSTDSGATWSSSTSVPPGNPRYGAFPTDTTWYVSSGQWGDSVTMKNSTEIPIFARVHYTDNKFSFVDYSFPRKTDGTPTGWFGAVSKTTDGGKTWTQVLTTNPDTDYVYFNAISCGSELNCIVVGEGQDAAGNPLVVAYTTFDGGVTWSNTLSANFYGLTGVKFTSPTSGWLGGTIQYGRKLSGQFWTFNDGGKSFYQKQALNDCFVLDMDFDAEGDLGAAACVSTLGTSCNVAMWD